ncbi:uncharacterized protein [Antedon mediterranea]|uniref:uncharacterized protein n=1 Tax=Antedon mediterranea TaxID=105859 RepID=UPI003AF494CC
MGTSQSSSHTLDHNDQTPMLQMGNRTQYPNALVTSSHSEKVNKTTTDVSSMDQPENVQEGRGYSLVLVEIICISIGLLLLILSMLIIVCLTRKIKRRKEEDCNTPAQSRRRLLYNAYECIDDLKSRSIINNAYSMYSINSLVEKDAVYQDISEIKRRDEQGGVNTGCVVVSGLGSGGKTVSRSKTWSHNDDFKERTLPRKSSSMGNERRPEMYVRRPLSKKTPPRIEFRRKVPRTPPPPVPSLPHTSHAHTFHVREYCSAPELPRARPHSDMNVQNNGLKLNSHHTVFLPPVQQNCDLSVVRMSNLTDNLAYSDAIYAEPRETLFDHEAKTSLAKSKDSAFDFDSEPEDETIWEDNPIYEDSDSLSDTDYTTSTLDYSESNLVFRIGCFADYDEMGGEFRKSHIYSEIPEIN